MTLFTKNYSELLRRSFRLTITYFLCMVVTHCVLISAASVINRMAVFYSGRDVEDYLVALAPEANAALIDAALDEYRTRNGRGHVMLLSKPDDRSSAVLMGMERPLETMWFLCGDEDAFRSMSPGKVFVDPMYVDGYRYLNTGFDEVYISGHNFIVAGIVELISELPRDYSSSDVTNLRVTGTDNEPLPLYSSINGEKYKPDNPIIVPLLISASDMIDLNVPLEYLHVHFADQPSPDDYQVMVDAFTPLSADGLEPYKTVRIVGFSLPVMLICLIAIALALILSEGMILSLYEDRMPMWNGLYILGCTPKRLWWLMMGEALLTYVLSFVLSVPLTLLFIESLLPINATLRLSGAQVAGLGAVSILVMALTALPAAWLATRNATTGGVRDV